MIQKHTPLEGIRLIPRREFRLAILWSPVLWFSLFVVATLAGTSTPNYSPLGDYDVQKFGGECRYDLKDRVLIKRVENEWGWTALEFWPFGTYTGKSLGLWPFVGFTDHEYYHPQMVDAMQDSPLNSNVVQAYKKTHQIGDCPEGKTIEIEQFNGILYGYDLQEAVVYSLLLPAIWVFRVTILIAFNLLVWLHSIANRRD
jgi:hypothetical protein